jgi:TonB family protein
VQRKAINQPSPDYPELARRMNLAGSVKLEVMTNADGTVKNTKVIGGNPVLAASAEKTVKTWNYEPAKYETTGVVTFNFAAKSRSQLPARFCAFNLNCLQNPACGSYDALRFGTFNSCRRGSVVLRANEEATSHRGKRHVKLSVFPRVVGVWCFGDSSTSRQFHHPKAA